jgi:hypothetical protein
MPTNEEVAQFMMGQFQEVPEHGRMRQASITRRIRQEFGDEFTYKNKNRNWAIKPEVLEEFRKLDENGIVWEQGKQAWRRRRESDKPGRMQK